MSLIIASYVIVFSLGYIIARLNDISKKLLPAKQDFSVRPPMKSSQDLHLVIDALADYLTTKSKNAPIEQISYQSMSRYGEPAVFSKPKIEIDDRKFISELKTDSLEKKFASELGTTTTVTDNELSANVSKLSMLKNR